MTGALILTGAPGAGKTSVLDALSTQLEAERRRFGAAEAEQLARGWPWLGFDAWLPGLAAHAAWLRGAGRDPLLVVATVESAAELRGVVAAAGASAVFVVCLGVDGSLAAARVAAREPDAWPGKAALVAHARELAAVIPGLPGIDAVIATADRAAVDVAAEIRALAPVRELLGG